MRMSCLMVIYKPESLSDFWDLISVFLLGSNFLKIAIYLNVFGNCNQNRSSK